MAQLPQAFDSSQHDDMQDGFDPFPAGEYTAMIVESSYETTAKKDGKYIKLKFQILKGEFKGRFVWTNLNVQNPSVTAVEIAQKELATICRCVGKGIIQDTQVLHGIPMLVKIKIKPAKGDYPAGNETCGYKPAKGAAKSASNEALENEAPGDDDDEPGWD